MNRYRYYILEAKINSAEGFGHPSTNTNAPSTRKRKPPTKEELGRWRARSDKFREDYLKKHPNSKFKDVPVRGNIVTRSKKVSSKPWAKEMSEHGVEALRNIGLKGSKLKYVAGKVAAGALSKFIKTKDRTPFLDTAKKVFNNYRNKLKPEDREALDKEAEQINKSDVAPSRTILRKAGKGLIFGLVGLAAGAAMYSGLVPADIAVYLGVKILDTSFETAKHSLREPLSTLIVANTISKFFNSSDSDDYADSTLKNMKRKGYEPEEEADEDSGDNLHDNNTDKSDEVDSTEQKPEETKPPEESDEEKLKRIIEQRLGPNFDSSKYYLDENGDLKRKGKKDAAAT